MKRQYSREKGYILVLMCFVLAMLLTVAAIALDIANMYRWRVRLERAARAGVTAGIGYRTLVGWAALYQGGKPTYSGSNPVDLPNTTEVTRLITHVQNVARENFNATFHTQAEATSAAGDLVVTTPTYSTIEDEVTVTLTYNVPMFLMDTIFAFTGLGTPCGTGGTCPVTTTQTANMRTANIALVLDVSGSMICPRDDASIDCPCRLDNSCVVGTRKIDDLKLAVRDFVRFFNPYRDRIALVPFNLGADPNYLKMVKAGKPKAFGEKENDWDEFDARIEDIGEDNVNAAGEQTRLPPLSSTNHCDGLIRAFKEVEDLQAAAGIPYTELRPVTLFFTDGAPNAMIGNWTNPFPEAPADRLTNTGRTNPWYHYSIEWSNGATKYRGPSMMVNVNNATKTLFNFQITSEVDAAGNTIPKLFPATATACGDAWTAEDDFPNAVDGSINTGARPPGCLSSLRFQLPFVTSGTTLELPEFHKEYVDGTGATRKVMNTDQLYYYCPILATDYHRTAQQGVVFSVGLGEPAPWCGDPGQDVDNSFRRKDGLLARLAVDEDTVDTGDPGEWKHTAGGKTYKFSPRANYTLSAAGACADHRFVAAGITDPMTFGYNGGPAPTAFTNEMRGHYFGVTKASYLQQVFRRIAKTIQLRLGT